MLNEGFQFKTPSEIRNMYLLAASEVVPIAFSSFSIKSSFRRAGIFPPSTNPILNNPCVTNVDQQTVIPKVKPLQVNIADQALINADEIPKRRAETLAQRAKRAAETRAKNKREKETHPTIDDLLGATLEDSGSSSFHDEEIEEEKDFDFSKTTIDEDEADFQNIGEQDEPPAKITVDNATEISIAEVPAEKTANENENEKWKKHEKEITFADTDLYKELHEKHKQFACSIPPSSKRIPHRNKEKDIIFYK